MTSCSSRTDNFPRSAPKCNKKLFTKLFTAVDDSADLKLEGSSPMQKRVLVGWQKGQSNLLREVNYHQNAQK